MVDLLPGMVGKSTRRRRPDLVQQVRGIMRSAPDDGIVGALCALRNRPDSTDTVRTIDVPTPFIVGEEDVLTPPATARHMQSLLPTGSGSYLDVIAGASHLSCRERPSAVNHVMAEFLERVQAH